MEKYIGKKYKLKTSDNFDDYLKYIGVGLLSRKLATSVSPVVTLTKDDYDVYTLSMTTAIRNVATSFKIGEEFLEERADGVKVQSLMTVEGDNLIQTQTENSGRISKHIREFTDNTLTVTTTADGWDGKCIRVYEIVN